GFIPQTRIVPLLHGGIEGVTIDVSNGKGKEFVMADQARRPASGATSQCCCIGAVLQAIPAKPFARQLLPRWVDPMPNAHELFGRQTRIGAKSEQNRFVGGNIVDKTALESRGADSIAQRRWIETSILHEAQQFFRVLCQIAE